MSAAPAAAPGAEVRVRPYEPADENAVVALWAACDLLRPQNDPRKDICRKRAHSPEWFLVGTCRGEIVASVMVGYDGHRGWINYLAVAPQHQRSGIGRRLMAEAERLLRGAGCPKINLQVRSSNTRVVTFYQRLGFVVDQALSLGKRLEQD